MSTNHIESSTEVPGLPEGYRPRQSAPVWQTPLEGWQDKLAQTLKRVSGSHQPAVFFRADDIGAGGRAFETMCHIFRESAVPLAMAVVPAWLSDVRKTQLFQSAPLDEPLWGWHQHGWRHVNWQRTGKKSEFGEHRPFEKQWRDIFQGRQKMIDIFGEHFVQVFTPPWNRLSNATLRVVQDLGFKGVSLMGTFPRNLKPPIVLANLRIQLDLHTRKSKDAPADYDALLEELAFLLNKKEPVGIMIHHHRMTPFAFQFLHTLISLLRTEARTRFLSFGNILETGNNE
ncbi:MAG: polysaccharide deacetylase family protein [Syntrophobacteraceae bacterium]|nr:polysaccharide deacetylase family protein [Desulfobacteraceae bacterium]